MGNFYNWVQNLNEMPLNKLTFIPNQDAFSPDAKRKYGWDTTDAKLLSNPSGVEKFKRLWENTRHDFDFYLVRSKNASKFREIGEVSLSWLQDNIPEVVPHLEPNSDAITVIFTTNTGAEKIPFTSWTSAHRFGHALTRSKSITSWVEFTDELLLMMRETLEQYYGVRRNLAYGVNKRSDFNILHKLGTGIGTFRSARQNNLRNFFEFNYEVFAQYLMSKNQVQFKKELPKILATKFAWGRPQGPRLKIDDPIETENHLQNIADYCNDTLGGVLDQCMGKIFVM